MHRAVQSSTARPLRWFDAFAFLAVVALFGVLHFARAVNGGLNHDEHQFIVPGALLARRGLLPFRDYPIFHLPNLTFIYALLDWLSSYLILACKSFSVCCATATTAIIAAVALRAGRDWWALALTLLLLVMVFCDPLFAFTSGKTWNHDLGAFLVVLAVFCTVENYSRHSLMLAICAGMAVGIAIGTRLTFAPVAVPICVAPLLFATPWPVRGRLVIAAGTGVAIAMLPTIWLWILSPDAFWFDNFQFPRLRLLDASDTRVQKTIVLWRKLRFFGKEIIRWSWPIFLAYLLFGIRPALQWWRDRSPVHFANALIAMVLPFLLIGCFAPSRYQYQHYFAFIPLLALAIAYGGYQVPFSQALIYRAALLLLTVMSVVLDFRATEKDGYAWIPGLARPERWFPVRAHRLAAEIRARVPQGKVLTLAPAWPIEGGLDIYPEFANGPFAWRLAHLLDAPQRVRFHIVAPADLDGFLAKDPPAAVLTGFENDDIEKPFRSYAKDHGYRRIELGKDRLLWLK